VSDVDLSALRMQQSDRSLPRRPVGPRLLIAAALALVLAVVATFAWPLLRPVRVVQMAPIRAIAAATGDAAIPIAEAVGWVEPDPFPVIVQSLVEGRIESIEVLEGAVVKAGETVIARLANASLLAARDRAAADLLQREAAERAEQEQRGKRREAERLAQVQRGGQQQHAQGQVERDTHVDQRRRQRHDHI
jgi:multidrug efflux pump subunit AcrA (membrane-fusion protein)